MSISAERDPLDATLSPDRVFYAVGALLGVQDFTDEQTYHRGRLARALSFLSGYGTLTGLKVDWQGPAKDPNEEIIIRAGAAIDRLGRLVEVPRDACIRLDTWYRAQTPSDLDQGFHAPVGGVIGVIVDVFLRFAACERALQPAFAAGPFDATDFVTPSRVREAYQLDLVIRKEGIPALPVNPWADFSSEPDLAKRHAAVRAAIYASWNAPAHQRDGQGNLVLLAEHVPNQDPAAIFLSRFTIPASAGNPPPRIVADVTPVDDSRPFVYPLPALARWIGV
jgi:hypothetical protein